MNRPVDNLDRMIDALNAHRDPADEGPVDSETSELVDLAHGLKELGQTQWPDESFPTRAAIKLSIKLGPTARFAVIARGHGTTPDERDGDDGPLPPLPADLDQFPESPRELRRPRRLRRSFEFAAAAAVLIIFTGIVTVLLKNANNGSADPTAQPGGNPATGSTSQSSTATSLVPTPTLVPTQSTTAAPTNAPTQAPSDSLDDGQALIALQSAVGFDLWRPGSIPEGLKLKAPDAPMTLPSFTSVVLKYVDADGTEALVITEASPYQDSAQTMPADVWNNAVPFTLPDGTQARLYQSSSASTALVGSGADLDSPRDRRRPRNDDDHSGPADRRGRVDAEGQFGRRTIRRRPGHPERRQGANVRSGGGTRSGPPHCTRRERCRAANQRHALRRRERNGARYAAAGWRSRQRTSLERGVQGWDGSGRLPAGELQFPLQPR